ncbi:MAG: MarR family winged helix-turn-helix transcriptional regulator [Candidatus Binataceae bacterium]
MVDERTRQIGRECVASRTRMLNRIITAVYDNALSGIGLKASQFNVLVAVANQGGSKPAELAKILHMDQSTLSRNVDRMCARGWLRLESAGDGRSHLITVTGVGAALIRKGYAGWDRAQAEVGRRLGPDGIAALRLVARKLRS